MKINENEHNTSGQETLDIKQNLQLKSEIETLQEQLRSATIESAEMLSEMKIMQEVIFNQSVSLQSLEICRNEQHALHKEVKRLTNERDILGLKLVELKKKNEKLSEELNEIKKKQESN